MTMRTILYEDSRWLHLLPLVYGRAVYQLLCGMDDLLAKVARLLDSTAEVSGSGAPGALELWCRPGLAEVVAERTGRPVNELVRQPALLLNGRGLWAELPDAAAQDASWVGVVGEQADVACIFADAELAGRLSSSLLLDEARTRVALAGLPRRDVSAHVRLFDWPWQIVSANPQSLIRDWRCQYAKIPGLADVDWAGCEGRWHGKAAAPNHVHARIDPGSYLLAEDSIRIERHTRVKPCVVIDAEEGPVWIGANVTILPHCYVQGPAFIGDGCLLQPGTVVHSGTTIGPRCKVGGEIEGSIIQGYSNKQHDGFLGHSYVGSWVNIAADCINSDLKNTYGTVRVPINGREVDTGEMFVGMIVGDFSKAGINVSFPTGAVIGFCSSVFAPRSPKFVPSFAWIDGDSVERFDETRGIALARKVMARRNYHMTAAEARAFLQVRQQALAIEHASQRGLEIVPEDSPASAHHGNGRRHSLAR